LVGVVPAVPSRSGKLVVPHDSPPALRPVDLVSVKCVQVLCDRSSDGGIRAGRMITSLDEPLQFA
jgi:hypothetical protein